MLTTFQKLCIRPELGFCYDKGSMVEVADGGSFSELLCKVTSKCDTSVLLLSSHKGKIRDFTVKLIGMQSPQSSSMTSTVLSGFKKGLSYLNGRGAVETQQTQLSETEQVAEAWEECESSGYHGMQVLALVDKEMMPDNDCRKLYNLHQFMTVTLQSINAYYMFQKPDVSFLYDADFNTEHLKQAYPNADTFAVAIIWRFAENPTAVTGRIRPTPIVRTPMRSAVSPAPSRTPLMSGSRTPLMSGSRIPLGSTSRTPLVSTSRTPLVPTSRTPVNPSSRTPVSLNTSVTQRQPRTTVSTTVVTTKKKVTETRDGNRLVHKTVEQEAPSFKKSFTMVESAEEDEDSEYEDVEQQQVEEQEEEEEEEEDEEEEEEENMEDDEELAPAARIANISPVRPPISAKVPSPFAIRGSPVAVSKKIPAKSTRVIQIKPMASVKPVMPASQSPPTLSTSVRRGRTAPPTASLVDELPSAKRVRGVPKRQAVAPRGRSKRKLPEEYDEEEGEEELAEDEITFRPPTKITDETCAMEVDDSNTTLNATTIALSFDDAPAKPRGGRKSMAARKSLANEWPADDQEHILHFYDNLNPVNSETSRVALTCKYALLQFDRDLSSKLLFTWLEKKGRASQREVTSYTLQESEQKATVMGLYDSLSAIQSEATRVSFTLKFIQSQYSVAVTSKQLFQWLKEKNKKPRK